MNVVAHQDREEAISLDVVLYLTALAALGLAEKILAGNGNLVFPRIVERHAAYPSH